MPEFESMMVDDEDFHYSFRFAPKPPCSIDHGFCDVLLSQRTRFFISCRCATNRRSASALATSTRHSYRTARRASRPRRFPVASLQNRYAASIMVAATCSCRSGLASLFLVAARQTAAVLLLWQLRPGTRIARLGAQASLALVFLPLRSKTAKQHRSWLLR